MPKPTKAAVTYSTGVGADAVESTLRFHAVIAEDHDVSSEITGYPAQNGFVVSNHSIIKNRKISITGAVTDTPIVGTDTFMQFGLDNKKIAFKIMNDLVRSSTPCRVQTNLGTYYPVIFNKFRTRTDKDWVNAIKFTFAGEEIQEGTSKDVTAPAPVAFTVIGDNERDAQADVLRSIGIDVADDDIISTATVDFGASFSLDTFNDAGEAITIVHEYIGTDPVTQASDFKVHTSDISLANAPTRGNSITTIPGTGDSLIDPELPDNSLEPGAFGAASCLYGDEGTSSEDTSSGYINTPSGYLKESSYGAEYGNTRLHTNSSFGQVLPSLGTDCHVVGKVGEVIEEDSIGGGLPTVSESVPSSIALTSTKPIAKLVKVSPASSANTKFFGDLL